MTSNFVARSQLVDWQVAPAEHEIVHYDATKIKYRRYVEEMINSFPLKSLKKKAFFMISTNVLCADMGSSRDTNDPIDRDIYLPLEISITKMKLPDWTHKITLDDATLDSALTTKVWMIHPGNPTPGNVCKSREHSQTHKIDYFLEPPDQNQYIEKDHSKILKEINSFLTAERIVFSTSLRFVRQDLGCLKWLNRAGGYKSSPIKVYSLEDLFVVLLRRIYPEFAEMNSQGLARGKLLEISDTLDSTLHCQWHQAKVKILGYECSCCAKAISFCNAKKLLEEMAKFSEAHEEVEEEQRKSSNQYNSQPNETKEEGEQVDPVQNGE